MGDWWGLTLDLWPGRMIHHLGQLQLVFCWQTHIILHQISTWDLTWEVRPSGLRCRYILLQSAKNSRPQQAWSPSAWMLSAITSDRGKWTQHGTSVEVVWWQKKHSLRMYEHLVWISATRINYHQLTARIFCLLQEISSCPTLAAASFRVASIAHCGLGLF